MSVETSQQLVYYPHNAWKEVLHNCQANTSIDMQYVWWLCKNSEGNNSFPTFPATKINLLTHNDETKVRIFSTEPTGIKPFIQQTTIISLHRIKILHFVHKT